MIPAETLDGVAKVVAAAAGSEPDLSALREVFPGVHFTVCSDDDVGSVEPVRAGDGFNLYLVDGRGHCLAFTNDPEVATGLVIAWVEAE